MYATWINFLSYELRALHQIPIGHPHILAKAFKKFPKTRIVIDCTEVYTKQPSGLEAQKQLFSYYKDPNTIKFLDNFLGF